MIEAWLPVVGFEGFYEVSNLGSVRSVVRVDTNGVPRGGHSMKTHIGATGYTSVKLCKNGHHKLKKVHHLVLDAFVGERPSGTECCHSDDVRANPRLDNLRWDTRKANCEERKTACGERNGGGGKLKESQVVEIKTRIANGERLVDIAKLYGVSAPMIGAIKKGRAWRD
jgi:hypothetical protein